MKHFGARPFRDNASGGNHFVKIDRNQLILGHFVKIFESDRFVRMLLEATVLLKTNRNQNILSISEPGRFAMIMLLEATVLFKTDQNRTILDHFVKHFGARLFRDNASGVNH